MTKWNQLGSSLGGQDTGDSRNFQRISLRRFQPAHACHCRALHTNERVGHRPARCCGLGGHVDHLYAACSVVMRKLLLRNTFPGHIKKVRGAAGYRLFRRLRALTSIHAPLKSNSRGPLIRCRLSLPNARLLRWLRRKATSLALEENAREAV